MSYLSAASDAAALTALGKGQGAKEIGHNLARERPKFGHNPACKRNEICAQFCGRSMKTWAQICKHCTMSENTETEIIYVKIFFYFFISNSVRALCKLGRAQGSSGRAQDSKGRAQRPQK